MSEPSTVCTSLYEMHIVQAEPQRRLNGLVAVAGTSREVKSLPKPLPKKLTSAPSCFYQPLTQLPVVGRCGRDVFKKLFLAKRTPEKSILRAMFFSAVTTMPLNMTS